MKKALGIILAAAMLLTLLAGCVGDTPAETTPGGTTPGETEAKKFKAGLVIWGTSDNHGRYLSDAMHWIESLGGEVVLDTGALSPDAMITSVENLIQADCDMIVFCTYVGEAIVPRISQLCQENEVYFAMWDTTLADAEIAALVAKNPYFCGTTNEDQVKAGYEAAKHLIELGGTDFILIKYDIGVPTCDLREEGALQAINEAGANVTYTLVAPSDTKKAVQDVLTSNTEVNALLSLGAAQNYCTPAIQAIEAVGKKGQVYVGGFDFGDDMAGQIASGDLHIVFGGHVTTAFFATVMTVNAYWGSPINTELKELVIPYIKVTESEDIDNFQKYIVGEKKPYTTEEIKQFTKFYNPELTYEAFAQSVVSFSVADIIARHGE